jgi:hypothetical protein
MPYLTTRDQHEILQDKNMILRMKHKMIQTCLQQTPTSNKLWKPVRCDAIQ